MSPRPPADTYKTTDSQRALRRRCRVLPYAYLARFKHVSLTVDCRCTPLLYRGGPPRWGHSLRRERAGSRLWVEAGARKPSSGWPYLWLGLGSSLRPGLRKSGGSAC